MGTLEPQHDPRFVVPPLPGHPLLPLVVDPADKRAKGIVLRDVVEAGRNGHQDGLHSL